MSPILASPLGLVTWIRGERDEGQQFFFTVGFYESTCEGGSSACTCLSVSHVCQPVCAYVCVYIPSAQQQEWGGAGAGVLNEDRKRACASGGALPDLYPTYRQSHLVCILFHTCQSDFLEEARGSNRHLIVVLLIKIFIVRVAFISISVIINFIFPCHLYRTSHVGMLSSLPK